MMGTLGSEASPLRVLMIGPYPKTPDTIDGGVASAVMYLSEALAARQDVDLIAVRIAKDPADACDVKKYPWPIVDLQLGRFGLSTLYLRMRGRFKGILERFRPDVVHGQESDIAGYLAVNSGYPTVITVHGILSACAKLQTDPVTRTRAMLAARLTERRTIRRASDLIAISSFVTRYYKNDIKGHVHYIPNAVASAFFTISRNLQPGRLLYAGRIANGKGLVELLHAFERARGPASQLVLAGATPDPAYERHIRSEAERLNLMQRVHFAGLLDEAALRAELSMAEALVLPSYQETAPMVIQEAMAAGVAVIATKVGGIPDQVEDGVTGVLCDAGDIGQLARAIEMMRTDICIANRLGAVAKSRAEQLFRASSVARATREVYREIVTRSVTSNSLRVAF